MLAWQHLVTLASLTIIYNLSQSFAQEAQSILRPEPPSQHSRPSERIAIIGAGAAGSSAAYHLSKFAKEANLEASLEIEIFEANSYVGGRTTTVNALNDPRYPVELGASIFVEINQILFNASKHFSLTTNAKIFESTGADYDLGVWDGDTFVFTTGRNSGNDDDKGGLRDRLIGWWDIAKLLWKYGLSPIRLRSLQQTTIGRFLKMYDEFFPFTDLTQAAQKVDLLSVTGAAGDTMLTQAGISEQFSREIIQASTRVNYAQNLQDFHGLETLVCMSTDGAMSVEGGNWLIFDKMIKSAGAKLHLNNTVTSVNVAEEANASSTVTFINGEGLESVKSFDTIILAHPYNVSQLTISPTPQRVPAKGVDYVELFVTLFTSPFRPSPAYFNLDPLADSAVPDTILTTIPEALDPDFLGRGVEGVGPTGFWSLSALRVLRPSSDGYIPGVLSSGHIPTENFALAGPQYLYKIFSPAPMTADDLIDIFGWQDHPELLSHFPRNTSTFRQAALTHADSEHSVTSLPASLVTWSYEKSWYSYPYLPPRTQFDCFDIYDCPPGRGDDDVDDIHRSSSSRMATKATEEEDDEGDIHLAGKLWYTSAIEPFISTMETSALSGRNIARLIVDRLLIGKKSLPGEVERSK